MQQWGDGGSKGENNTKGTLGCRQRNSRVYLDWKVGEEFRRVYRENMIEKQKATARICLVFSKLLILLYGNELQLEQQK